ncbi:metallophosphoesterase [Paenibacillus sp. FSL R5-0887]|uniref:metallophosphoesterase n=1 Tax=Paenibacillus sp. FSL R5-0887 TaxID=2921662 RepID=UPI0030F61967
MVFAFLFIFAMYAATNYYIARKIFKWLQHIFSHINGIIYGVIYSLCALSIIINLLLSSSAMTTDSNIVNFIGQFGDYWMGIYFYLFLLLILSDVILLISKWIKVLPSPIPARVIFHTRSIVLILVIGLVSYGIYNANHLKEVTYPLQIHKNTSLDQLNIVLISDLHLGYVNDVKFIEDVVDRINGLQPDIVLMTGDIFNGNYYALSNPSKGIELLSTIQSTYGVYACLGNHDAGRSYDEIVNFIDKSNIKLLNDEHVVIDNQFVVVGRRDSSPIGNQGNPRAITSEVMSDIDTNMPVIVMDHQPTNRIEYADDVDLILSGHTHQGQVFPANLITNAMFTVDYGHYQKNSNSPHVIVTSGAGTWGPPLRIGTNSEIAQIKVDFK